MESLSLWIDEFPITYKLHQVKFTEILPYFLTFHSDQAPISHLVYYFFYHLFPFLFGEIDNLRWVSVLIGTLNIFLVYLVGKITFSERVGLFSAFLFAVSPYHALFAQLIRPYIFVESFSIASLLVTVRLIKNASFINLLLWVIINILLLLSHLMMVLLVVIEIFFLSLYAYSRGTIKKTLAYITILTLLSLFIPMYFMSRSVPIYTIEDDYLMRPSNIFTIFADLLGDDAILATEPFFHQGQSSKIIPGYWIKELVNLHFIFDTILMVISFVSLGLVISKIIQQFKSSITEIYHKRFWEYLLHLTEEDLFLIFFIAVVVLPISAIVVMSFLRPCYQTRYTLYSSIGLYILVSYAIGMNESKGVKKILIFWLLISILYQSFIAGLSTKTTNFKQMTRVLKSKISDGDGIFSMGMFYLTTPITNEIIAYYLKSPIEKVTPVYSVRDFMKKSKEFFLSSGENKFSIWLIIEPYVFKFPNENVIEYILWKSKINFEKYFFPGMNGLWLYRLQKTEHSFSEEVEVPEFVDYSCWLKKIKEVAPNYDLNKVREKLRELIDFYAPPTIMFFNYVAWCALDRGDAEFAEICARCAISLNPNVPWGYHSLAVSLMEQGRKAEGIDAMNKCKQKDRTSYHSRKYYPIFEKLYGENDVNLARILIRTLESEGGYIPIVYKRKANII